MEEESPEGGRFKKEIFIDNQSYLLLIRDEGGLPEMQVGSFQKLLKYEFWKSFNNWINVNDDDSVCAPNFSLDSYFSRTHTRSQNAWIF